MRKVYPEKVSKAKDNVQIIVQDVDENIERILAETNNIVAGMHPNRYGNIGENVNIGNRNQQIPMLPRSQNPEEDDDVRPFDENVKLSHEIMNNEKEIATELKEKYSLLQSQLEEYYKLYQQTNSKLKETENRCSDMENKYHSLEEEKINLESELQKKQVLNQNYLQNMNFNKENNNVNNGNNSSAFELQKRSEELRKLLLFENDDEDIAISLDFFKGKDFGTIIQDFWNYILPFKKDIRTIQSRYGTSVASYFLFYRFLFLQCLLVALFLAACLVLHLINFDSLSLSTLSQFDGELPYILSLSSFSPEEGLLYDFIVLVPLCIFLVTIILKLKYEDKIAKHLDAMDSENSRQYSKEILAIWDNSLRQPTDIDEYSSNLYNKFLQLIEETTIQGKQKKRSDYETVKVYGRRSLGMFYYLLLVATSFSVIIYVTIFSSEITQSANQVSFLKNFTSFLVTIILNIINGATPTILQKLTEVEGWDSASTVSNIVLLRLYLSNLLNALILAASYIVLADPFLLANHLSLRNSISVKENNQFDCRFNQVGSGLLTLVLVTWALDLISLWAIPVVSKLVYVNILKDHDEKNWKTEFLVAPMMIKRLNFLGLTFLSLSFTPFVFIILPFLLFISFKMEKLILKYYYTKPLRPWKGQKAGVYYTSLYFFSFLFIGLLVNGYFLKSKTFAKSCDIQDDNVHLCQDNTFDSSTNICDVLKSSEYYHAYGKSGDYPNNLCAYACGPFIHNADNLQPFSRFIVSTVVLDILWEFCFEYPVIPWIGLMLFIMMIFLYTNTIEVMKVISFNKEKNMQSHILSLEAERKKQIKIINKLKTIETTSIKKTD